MFVDSVIYLFQNYWFILLLVGLVGFYVGWKSCAAAN